MVWAQILLTLGLVLLLVFFALLAHPWDVAYPKDKGETWDRALAERAEQARLAAERAEAKAKERRRQRHLDAGVDRFSREFGSKVGRWFPLVHEFFPHSEHWRAMYCIAHESGGDPNAGSYYKGLFQLGGWHCNVWPPHTNVKMAARRWRQDGWRPWTVMWRWW